MLYLCEQLSLECQQMRRCTHIHISWVPSGLECGRSVESLCHNVVPEAATETCPKKYATLAEWNGEKLNTLFDLDVWLNFMMYLFVYIYITIYIYIYLYIIWCSNTYTYIMYAVYRYLYMCSYIFWYLYVCIMRTAFIY